MTVKNVSRIVSLEKSGQLLKERHSGALRKKRGVRTSLESRSFEDATFLVERCQWLWANQAAGDSGAPTLELRPLRAVEFQGWSQQDGIGALKAAVS